MTDDINKIKSGFMGNLGKAVSALMIVITVIIAMIIGFFWFRDDIDQAFNFKRQVEENTEKSEYNSGKINILNDSIFSLKSEENKEILKIINRLAALERDTSNILGDLERVQKEALQNTNWRDDQEKRAERRKTQQEFREKRLAKGENDLEELYREIIPKIKQDLSLVQQKLGDIK